MASVLFLLPFSPFFCPVFPVPPNPSHKAVKRVARQEKFGYVNTEAEKKAKKDWLAAEQAEKKAKRIARFGEDTTPTPAPKSSTSSSSGRSGGGRGGGKSGGKGQGRGGGGRGGGGRRQGGKGGGAPVSASTMLSQGLKSSR